MVCFLLSRYLWLYICVLQSIIFFIFIFFFPVFFYLYIVLISYIPSGLKLYFCWDFCSLISNLQHPNILSALVSPPHSMSILIIPSLIRLYSFFSMLFLVKDVPNNVWFMISISCLLFLFFFIFLAFIISSLTYFIFCVRQLYALFDLFPSLCDYLCIVIYSVNNYSPVIMVCFIIIFAIFFFLLL